MGVKISHGTKTNQTCKSDIILNFYTFIPFLQDTQSVFQDASAWVMEGLVLKV